MKPISVVRSRAFVFCLLMLVCVLVFVRATRITSDPPPKLSWSGGYYGDEAGYAHNARNKALFGKWVLDDFNPYLFNPVLTLFDYIFFKMFSPSTFSLRLVALFWGILGIFFVYGTLKTILRSFWLASLGVLLLETNYFFVMYTRLSLSDTLLTNCMLMTLLFWAIGLERSIFRFLAGLSAVVVMSCKPTAAYFSLVVLAAYGFHAIQDGRNWKESLRYIFSFAAGFLLGFFLWLSFFYIPHYAEISRISKLWSQLSLPKGIRDFLTYTMGSYAPIVFKYFSWFPFVFLFGWLYLPISVCRLAKDWRGYNPLEFFSLLWFILGYFAISGFHYRPPRYFISLVPPLVFIAFFGMRQAVALSLESLRRNIFFLVAYVAWIGLTVILVKWYIRFNPDRLVAGFILFVVVVVVVWIIKDRVPLKRTFVKPGAYLVFLIVFLAVSQNVGLFLKWWSHPSYQVVNASRKIGKVVNNGFIAGLWAPMLCMENRNRTLYIASHWFNDKRPYKRYHFTHLILWRGNFDAELTLIKKPLGKDFIKNRLKLILEFPIKGARTMFFEVVDKN